MLNAGADQKGDPGAAETRKGSGEGKSARPAFGRVLLRQPQGINRKIRAAKTEKEKANQEPGERCSPEIENHSKRERDEDHHQREKESQGAAPSEFFREPGHRETTQNCRKGDEQGRARSELCRRWRGLPRRFRKLGHRSGNVYRSCPEAANRSQHKQGIQNRSAAQGAGQKLCERLPAPPAPNDPFFPLPALRLGHAIAHPSEEQGRQSADSKHVAPSKFAANRKVEQRRQKNSHVITRLHVACASATPAFRPLLVDKRPSHPTFAAHP